MDPGPRSLGGVGGRGKGRGPAGLALPPPVGLMSTVRSGLRHRRKAVNPERQ